MLYFDAFSLLFCSCLGVLIPFLGFFFNNVDPHVVDVYFFSHIRHFISCKFVVFLMFYNSFSECHPTL